MSTTIGILGGMGPRATAYFEQKLLEQFRGPDQSVPCIVAINDGSIPDRTAFLRGIGADPVPALVRSAQRLMLLKPDLVCMPCNTAHAELILGRLQARILLPIVDMPAAALAEAAGHRRVLILGTVGTRLAHVYDRRTVDGIAVTYPDATVQAAIDDLIADTKMHGFKAENQQTLEHIVNHSSEAAVILACTELSMLNRNFQVHKVVIDALEALAARTAKITVAYAVL